jgi:hypothetical protein
LLNLYFTEDPPLEEEKILMYIKDIDGKLEAIDMEDDDYKELVRTHPLKRGDFFEEE